VKNFVVLIHKTVHVVESSLSCLCAIRRVLTSKAMKRLLQAKRRLFRTDFSPCYPQANSTVLDAFPIESGYVTKGSKATDLPLNDEVDLLGNCGMDNNSEVRTRP